MGTVVRAKIDAVYLTHTGTHPRTGQPRHAFWTAYTAERPDGGWRVAVNYGELETDGQTQVKDFPDQRAATVFVNRKITEKHGKGYRELDVPPDVALKGEQLLDLPRPEAPKTANLLEVCEASVATAVDIVTSEGLTVEQIERVQAARRAMTELRRRVSELEAQAELVDALLASKVGA